MSSHLFHRQCTKEPSCKGNGGHIGRSRKLIPKPEPLDPRLAGIVADVPQTQTRPEQLGTYLQEDGSQAYFAFSPVTMGYLSNFHEAGAERFLVLAYSPKGEQWLICPSLTVNQATRAGITKIVPLNDGQNPADAVAELQRAWGLDGKILVDDDMPAALLLKIQSLLPSCTFHSGWPVFSKLARHKDATELKHLFTAGDIADRAVEAVYPRLKAGLTEKQVAKMLEQEMAEMGGEPMFAIVGTGSNGSEPHHHTDDTVIQDGDVLIMDFGCRVHGYHSDITRTVLIGEREEAHKIYEIVYRAHMAARSKIRPGALSGEIDKAARDIITDAGYGEFFTHRTGHGLGMKVHEEPYIMPGGEIVLEVGDCFSIEPGIYLPGKFGVRIENIVTVTESGHESFNVDPPAEILTF